MKSATPEEVCTFRDAVEWKTWLARHHGDRGGIWLRIAKKGAAKKTIAISEALDVALCYGWIDSQRKRLDENYYLQRYSARQRRSPWSKLNVERAEALIAAKRMRAPGFAEIARAKGDGRWAAAYESQRRATLPTEFIAALDADIRLRAAFENLSKTAQFALVLPVLKAVNPSIRSMRVQSALAKLRKGASQPSSSTHSNSKESRRPRHPEQKS